MKRALLFSLLLTNVAIAGPEVLLQGGLLTPDIIATIKPELELSSDQETRMTEIVTAARSEAGPLDQAVRERQKTFNQILRKSDSPVEEASAALAQLIEAEAVVKQLQLRTLLSLRDVLSLEQQKKALTLAPARQAKRADLETRVREKAVRLKLAVEALGVPPTNGMKERGSEVEALIREGEWSAADEALNKLIIDSEVDEPESTEILDFSTFDPGSTDLETLKERYLAVETAVQSVISIQKVRQLIQAKQAMEEAKAAEDAVAVGRILTWAESVLKP